MKHLFLLLLIVLSTSIFAQRPARFSMAMRVTADTFSVKKIDREASQPTTEKIILPMDCGDFAFRNAEELGKLKGVFIEKIELIYTIYPSETPQNELNRKRFGYLYLLAPDIFNGFGTQWIMTAQTGARNDAEARNYFHGFVIHYRPVATLASMTAEKKYVNDVVDGKQKLRDSTVIKVLERNQGDWKKMLVVADFTGSMSPYIAQILIWCTLHQGNFNGFVFFNDGDMTPDNEKIAGKTGGIYDIGVSDPDSVILTASKTIANGGGGDAEENNVEALLYATGKYPDAKEVVMIADNWVGMRDTMFIKDVKKPVKIIVCGSRDGLIHPEYLDLAYRTGGSVHTMEADITDLSKRKEGELFTIGKSKYKLVKGKFVWFR